MEGDCRYYIGGEGRGTSGNISGEGGGEYLVPYQEERGGAIMFTILTKSATVKFHSQLNVAIPCLWVETDVASFDGWYQAVDVHKVTLNVSLEYSSGTSDLVRSEV